MVCKKDLEWMGNEEICGKDPATLPDLREVHIHGENAEERFESFLAQVGNPYCFRVGSTPVKIRFSGEKSIENLLKSHFIAIKS